MKKLTWMLLIAILCSMSLTACGGSEELPVETVTLPTLPELSNPEAEDTTDYALLLTTVFADLAETRGSDFEVMEVASGYKIVKYTGTDSKVRVPEKINGVSVTAIGDDAFRDRSDLTVLYIPDSVVAFGTDALKGCSNLYALRTPLSQKEGTSYLGYLYGAETYETNNTADLRALDLLELGGNLTNLPSYALYDCNDLLAVRLPESVTVLESYSLYRCESLKYLNTEKLTQLKTHSMAFCIGLESLSFTEALQTVELGALEGCRGLRRLTLPFLGGSRTENNYLSYLFGAADPAFSQSFYPADGLLAEVTVTGAITAVSDHAFYNCTSLQAVYLPSSVHTLGVRAFSGCQRLTAVKADGLQTVRESAFYGCWYLKSIAFAEGLTSLGVNVFADCYRLETVTLPQSLKSIPNSCFFNCRSLVSVHLGGVATVGENAFRNCTALQSLTAAEQVSFEKGNETAEKLLQA